MSDTLIEVVFVEARDKNQWPCCVLSSSFDLNISPTAATWVVDLRATFESGNKKFFSWDIPGRNKQQVLTQMKMGAAKRGITKIEIFNMLEPVSKETREKIEKFCEGKGV